MGALFFYSTRAALLGIGISVAPGCGVDGVPPLRPMPDAPGQPSTRGEPADAGCAVELSPEPALLEPVELAAERWSAATGCTVFVGDAGVPFRLATPILRPDGSDSPGATSATRDEVLVNTRSRPLQKQRTALHELGHVLGGDHTESLGVLSGHKEHGYHIDAEALESVCARLPCRWISPE